MTYYLAYTHPDGSPGATTEPMPEGQLKSTILSLSSQGYTDFRAWAPAAITICGGSVVVGGTVLP